MQTNMTNHKYYNFKQRLTDLPRLLTMDEIQTMKIDPSKEHYISIFRYNDEHKKLYVSSDKPSIKGSKFHDVLTDKLVWDFDDAANPENARQDVIALGLKLNSELDIDPDDMHVSYSGNKGFHLEVKLDRDITQEQFKTITGKIATGLPTYDPSVCDPARVLRLEQTANPKTGLYKIPIDIAELQDMNMDQVKEIAKAPKPNTKQPSPVKIPEHLFTTPTKLTTKKISVINTEFDPKSAPRGWKVYKWALADGFFEPGERQNALMVIASTCRALGYDKEATYYQCKSALKKQARRSGQTEFSKEELWTNIIEDSVFSDGWEGGSYSPKNNPWLKSYCERMGFDTEDKEELPITPLEDLDKQFIDFSTNFEQNIIKTGISKIDENLLLCIGTLNGLLGQPGSGKTTVAMEILKNASLNNIPSMFFSLDMGPQIVYAKLVQKESGLSFKEAMKLYREGGVARDEVAQVIKEKYGKIGFNFRCGSTVADLKHYLVAHRETTGLPIKFVVVDYLELISGPYSDPTANAAVVVHGLKNLATEENVCILLLLQTQKHSTPDISDPLTSMKQIKGSSAIEQDCSTVLTLWREGYNPDHVEFDKYISFALVKNRFDSLWKGDFHWSPVKGNVRELTEEEAADLEAFKKKKKQERAQKDKADSQDW